MYKNAFFTIVLLLAVSVAVWAKSRHETKGASLISQPGRGIDLIENKGQWTSEVRFKADLPGGVMFMTDKGFVYNYVSQEDMGTLHELSEHGRAISGHNVHLHAYKVKF